MRRAFVSAVTMLWLVLNDTILAPVRRALRRPANDAPPSSGCLATIGWLALWIVLAVVAQLLWNPIVF